MPDTGVILVNLGTPAAPTAQAVRAFLQPFLSDRRVVDLPRLLWWPLLHGIILPLRSPRVAHAYASIWQPGGSPLLVGSQALAAGVEQALAAEAIPVALAMTYGEPSLAQAWQQLKGQGVSKIVLLPLYPQYSSTTTAPVLDAWQRLMADEMAVPGLTLIRDYHDHPAYINALAAQVREHWAAHGQAHLLMSFHGIPARYARHGDDYPQQCRATAEALAARLELSASQWSLSFQSRFGREPWLQPYTDQRLAALPGEGVRVLDVICPGFATDCLETLEEIAVAGREQFLVAGGERFHYLPALNAHPDHVACLQAVIAQTFAR